jgi:hypothetical protein
VIADVEGVVLVLGVAFLAGAVGLIIGMLVAPRLTRWSERSDEEDPQG